MIRSSRVSESTRLVVSARADVELRAGVARDDVDEPGLVGVFAAGGSRPRGVERLIPGPCLDRGQQGVGVEDDRLGVRLEILTAAMCAEPTDLPDVAADVQSVQVKLLTQRRLTARDGVPQGRRDRSDLSRLVNCAIDGGDERPSVRPTARCGWS